MGTKSQRPQLTLVVFLTAIVLTMPARASSVEIPSLVHYSEIILFGKTVSVSCQWAEDTPCIVSQAAFQVENCLRGNYRSGDVVTIESEGGEINGMKQRVPNAPTFTRGQYAFVFLNSKSNGRLSVPYGVEGVISCSKQGKKMVARNGKALEQIIEEVKEAMGE